MQKVPGQYNLLEVCYYKASKDFLNWSESRKDSNVKLVKFPLGGKDQCLYKLLSFSWGRNQYFNKCSLARTWKQFDLILWGFYPHGREMEYRMNLNWTPHTMLKLVWSQTALSKQIVPSSQTTNHCLRSS